MAGVTNGVTPLTSTANGVAYTTGSFVPALNDLLVTFVIATATDSAGSLTDSQGLGWTLADPQVFGASSTAKGYCYVADSLAAASAMTVTFDPTGDDPANGCIGFVARVSGMTKVGAAAVAQVISTIGAATTPAITFASAVTTTNPTLVCVGNEDDSTPTEPTGWTERGDTTYLTPQTGGSYASRDSGFTGTTVTWGSSLADNFVAFGIELDASADGPTEVPLGLLSETDTSQAFSVDKNVSLGLPSETDTAQSITPRKNVALGLPVETNTAQAFTAQKTQVLGLPTETDTAQALAPQKVVALGLNTETDSALAMSVRKVVHLGIATETDSALQIAVDDGTEDPAGGSLLLTHLGS